MHRDVPIHGCIGNPCYICHPGPPPQQTIIPGLYSVECQLQLLMGEFGKLNGILERVLLQMNDNDRIYEDLAIINSRLSHLEAANQPSVEVSDDSQG